MTSLRLIYVFLTILILPFQVNANELVPVVKRTFKFNGLSGKLKNKRLKAGSWEEVLTWNKKKVISYTKDHQRNQLNSIELMKLTDEQAYLVLTWHKGAHSQTLEVWSLKDKTIKKTWEKTSYLAGFYEKDKDTLLVHYYVDGSMYPKEKVKRFN